MNTSCRPVCTCRSRTREDGLIQLSPSQSFPSHSWNKSRVKLFVFVLQRPGIFARYHLFSACNVYVPLSSDLAWWTTRVVVAPPWYSSVITVKFSFELNSPWSGCHQVNTGGGSPRHLICQKAVLFTRTVLDPAWPLSIDGETNNYMNEIIFSQIDE